jgi:molybdopterin molybdotransferase
VTTRVSLPTPSKAEAIIRECSPRLPIESRPLCALTDAVLAQSVCAERDQPPFNRVKMDGIAIASSSWMAGCRRYRVAGTQAAGHPPLRLADANDCIEVMTGAELPGGCDCVIPVEQLAVADGWAEIEPDEAVFQNKNIDVRGLDCAAGEVLLEPGIRLGSSELTVIASAGLARADVSTEPRIMIVSTGDELIEPGEAIEPWQVRRSNNYGMRASLASRGYCRVSDDHLVDDPQLLRDRLATHLATHDVLVLSGGVSMGKYDYVPGVLRELGVRQAFHRVAQRPGKPLWFGVTSEGRAVYGLPGNPVSALVCLVRYVVPGLAAALGEVNTLVDNVPLATAASPHRTLTFFLPVRLQAHPVHGRTAEPKPTRGSGDIISLLGTHGFVELPPGDSELPAGHVVRFYRW